MVYIEKAPLSQEWAKKERFSNLNAKSLLAALKNLETKIKIKQGYNVGQQIIDTYISREDNWKGFSESALKSELADLDANMDSLLSVIQECKGVAEAIKAYKDAYRHKTKLYAEHNGYYSKYKTAVEQNISADEIRKYRSKLENSGKQIIKYDNICRTNLLHIPDKYK